MPGHRVVEFGSICHARERGQSIAEFALVLPILLIVFVTIADFGRIFATSIEIEAATRNAAEAAANQYISASPGSAPLNAPAPAGDATYYDAIHAYAASVVCTELRDLPNTNYDLNTSACPNMPDGHVPPDPPLRPDMPVVLVCVHDSQDTSCASRADPGVEVIPPECTSLSPSPTPDQLGGKRRWVEVRTCYLFTATLNMPFFSLGNFWLQSAAAFTIPCYFALGTPDECG